MRSARVVPLLVIAATAAHPRTLAGQSANDLLAQGVTRYQKLEYDAAVTLLRQSLMLSTPAALPDSQRARALSYLAATELFQGHRDSAATAFQTLVRLDPRYRPDELIFPPQVTNLFQEVRRATKVLRVEVPPQADLHPRLEWFTARLIASSMQNVAVTLARDDGTPVRTLYDGPVADSLAVKWDGLTAGGVPPDDGRYILRVAPKTITSDGPRPMQVALDITQVQPDTLAWPPPPAGPGLLPERTSSGPALGSLAAGGLAAGAVVVLPSLLGRRADATGARFAVAAAVSLAGIVGFVVHQPRPIEANIKANANDPARRAWQRRVDDLKAENARRRGAARLAIRAGPVTVADRGAP